LQVGPTHTGIIAGKSRENRAQNRGLLRYLHRGASDRMCLAGRHLRNLSAKDICDTCAFSTNEPLRPALIGLSTPPRVDGVGRAPLGRHLSGSLFIVSVGFSSQCPVLTTFLPGGREGDRRPAGRSDDAVTPCFKVPITIHCTLLLFISR